MHAYFQLLTVVQFHSKGREKSTFFPVYFQIILSVTYSKTHPLLPSKQFLLSSSNFLLERVLRSYIPITNLHGLVLCKNFFIFFKEIYVHFIINVLFECTYKLTHKRDKCSSAAADLSGMYTYRVLHIFRTIYIYTCRQAYKHAYFV